jgi:regulator of nucleoside diphosphate kinase
MNTQIIITEDDHAKLMRLIHLGDGLTSRDLADVRALADELALARIVAPEDVPSDVITLNSRAELLDLDTNERMEFTIVLPYEADLLEEKISVLAPLGRGMLGYRVGDVFEQATPHGARRLQVLQVYFQPEAVLTPNGWETCGVALA